MRIKFIVLLLLASIVFVCCNDKLGEEFHAIHFESSELKVTGKKFDFKVTVPCISSSYTFKLDDNYVRFNPGDYQITYFEDPDYFYTEIVGEWFSAKIDGMKMLLNVNENTSGKPRKTLIKIYSSFGNFSHLEVSQE